MSTSSSISCRLAVVLSLLALTSAAAATLPPASPETAAKFLTAVNNVRRQANAPPVSWDATVAERARQRADWVRWKCDLAQKDKDPGGDTGGPKSYFLKGGGGGRVAPVVDAVGAWAGERRWYDAGNRACVPGKQCGDYMFMVDPKSRQLGCAVAPCAASGKTIVVCEYYPWS
uniref:SCP domain-containing protein n=1 Tax=Leersia perrieri TaxID=77586 RepID=A0A0D9W384_9ORYZ